MPVSKRFTHTFLNSTKLNVLKEYYRKSNDCERGYKAKSETAYIHRYTLYLIIFYNKNRKCFSIHGNMLRTFLFFPFIDTSSLLLF